MALETIAFLDDRMHSSVAAASIFGASSTANGYNQDAIRETDFKTAWKPADSSSDEYVTIDLGSTTAIGTTGQTAWFCIAYDARGSDQTTLSLRSDSTDNPSGGTWLQAKSDVNVSNLGPTVMYDTISISSPGKRYYRVYQLNGTRGGGTKTCRIFAVGLFADTGVHQIGVTDANVTSPGAIRTRANNGAFRSMSAQMSTNRNGASIQAFDLSMLPFSKTSWETFRDKFFALKGADRAIYLQFEGLRNYAKEGFQMVRLDGSRWGGPRRFRDEIETTLPFRTEAWV